MRILTASEMKICDGVASSHVGIPSRTLMESAGRMVAHAVLQLPRGMLEGGILVVAGNGNNGGDGYVAARALYEMGWNAEVLSTVPLDQLQGDSRLCMEAFSRVGGRIHTWDSAYEFPERKAIIIDAIFGTGYSRAMDQNVAFLIEAINAVRYDGRCFTIAVDVPSGVVCDTGAVINTSVQADATIALQSLKPCHVLPPGRDLCGEVFVAEIGVSLSSSGGMVRELLRPEPIRTMLKGIRRSASVHKGERGHVLVIGGYPGTIGAAMLSGRAALRAGAGLVTVAVPDSAWEAALPQLQELMGAKLRVDEPERALHSAVAELIEGKKAVVVGPGLGVNEGSKKLVSALVKLGQNTKIPFVFDADSLNIIAQSAELLKNIPSHSVLTPHPGEMARLRKSSVAQIEAERFESASAFSRASGASVVLKGAFSVVASPAGQLWVSPHAQASLATAGSGDVLSGMIGAYLAQGLSPDEAAILGVYLHGEAGSVLGEGLVSGGVGAVAHEIADLIPKLSTAALASPVSQAPGFVQKILPPPLLGEARGGR